QVLSAPTIVGVVPRSVPVGWIGFWRPVIVIGWIAIAVAVALIRIVAAIVVRTRDGAADQRAGQCAGSEARSPMPTATAPAAETDLDQVILLRHRLDGRG